jgi:hypothetical protein
VAFWPELGLPTADAGCTARTPVPTGGDELGLSSTAALSGEICRGSAGARTVLGCMPFLKVDGAGGRDNGPFPLAVVAMLPFDDGFC